ncbi:DUF6382 domain-containing protein [Cohnella thermotolerans]|uniref:DUF6382 domain-containing protein n=1 Tax=Cohnella thermotolerans TaxID=329858 RepID=UPI00040B8585|nr:DUF6382 domain-containing protein [Cohnella thermotolerans]
MNGYRVRFEQGRGHRMVVEGEPPIGSGEIDPIQFRMLRSCEVLGVMKLETEEMDGAVALRYYLSGRRMLSQSFRTARWTMEDAMNALCRLAEVLEQGREYMLDLERYVLDDDFIFVGESWHDLALTYLPLWRQTASVSVASGLERLIVRWLMNVDAPDGAAMQQLLRLAASPDFSPALLRRYVRQYLAGPAASEERPQLRPPSRLPGGSGAANGQPQSRDEHFASPADGRREEPPGNFDSPRPGSPHGSKPLLQAFSRLQKPLTAPQSLSGLLGQEDTPWHGKEDEADGGKPPESAGRRRLWLLAGAAVATAAVWRFAYSAHPGQRSLLLCSGFTFLVAGACFFLWDGKKSKEDKRKMAPGLGQAAEEELDSPSYVRAHDGWESEQKIGDAGVLPRSEPSRRFGGLRVAPPQAEEERWPEDGEYGQQAQGTEEAKTSWLPSVQEGTRLLSSERQVPGRPDPYLEWETDGGKRRIRLEGDSLVVGRSKEAAQHVDDTDGVSRAHLEFIRGQAAWQARDLGSRNGSWLNGVPMAPYEVYPLNKGDSIQIASSLYRYQEG